MVNSLNFIHRLTFNTKSQMLPVRKMYFSQNYHHLLYAVMTAELLPDYAL